MFEMPSKYRKPLISICEWHQSFFYQAEPPNNFDSRRVKRILETLYECKEDGLETLCVHLSDDYIYNILTVIGDAISNIGECNAEEISEDLLMEMNDWVSEKYESIRRLRR